MTASVQLEQRCAGNALLHPLRMGEWHERVGRVVKDQRGTLHRSGGQPRFVHEYCPVVFDSKGLYRAAEFGIDKEWYEGTRGFIIHDFWLSLAAHVFENAARVATQLACFPSKAHAQQRQA